MSDDPMGKSNFEANRVVSNGNTTHEIILAKSRQLEALETQLAESQAKAERATAEAATLLAALQGANWIINKLAPHETMAIQLRGFRPSAGDIAQGAEYSDMIFEALNNPALAADRMAKDEAMRKALESIARHPDGDDEPGEGNARHGAWEMSQIAREALGEKDG